MRLRSTLFLIACSLASLPARGEDSTSNSQLSLRIGLLTSNLSIGSTNKISETLTVPQTLDFDYEVFSTNRRSFFVRGTLAYDLSQARVSYLYFGGGLRFYLIGNGMTYDRSDVDGTRVSSSATSRLFLGPDFGLSKVELRSGTTTTSGSSAAVTLSSANFDLGVHLGYVLQLSRSFGIEALAGGSFVYGFTTVSAVGTTIRAMVGITQYF